jgi:hypothetical protein
VLVVALVVVAEEVLVARLAVLVVPVDVEKCGLSAGRKPQTP